MVNYNAMSIQDLGKAKTDLLAKIDGIALSAKLEARDLNDNEITDSEAAIADVETINQIIDTRNRQSSLTARAAALRGTGNAAPSQAAQPQISGVRNRIEDDPTKGFKSRGEFFSEVMKAGIKGSTDNEGLRYLSAAGSDEHAGANDAYGGFTIPETFLGNLMTVDPELDQIAGRVMRITMQSPTVHISARTDKNHSTSVTGGLRVVRRAETEEVSATRMATERITLTANSLMGVSYATEELLTDSPLSFAQIIGSSFAQEISSKIMNERLNGTGVGEFEGVLNSPATVSVAKETSQTAATINLKNIVKMYARLWGKDQGVWLANHDTIPQIAQLNHDATNGSAPAWMPSLIEGQPDRLYGRPIFFTEYCATLGTVGDILLCNWSQYLEGVLGGTNFAESVHVRFVNNERAFRVTLRNDGRGWWRSALTPKNGATLSPFISLATRA
jgi:HK97 family phage major capsid protein